MGKIDLSPLPSPNTPVVLTAVLSKVVGSVVAVYSLFIVAPIVLSGL